MKQLMCELCGSKDLIKQDGVFVCKYCGCQYSLEEAKKLIIKGSVQIENLATVEALLKRTYMFLEEKEFKQALDYANKVLDIEPENAMAYLYMLMAELKVSKQEDLKNCESPFDDNINYQKAVRFGDNTLISQLKADIQFINDRNIEEKKVAEIARLDTIKRLEKRRKELAIVSNFISAGWEHTVGLKSDGTVVAIGKNDYNQCDVSGWTDIVAVSTGTYHTVGLKSDGTVVSTKCGSFYNHGQCDVENLRDIIAISAYDCLTACLKSDGTVVTLGYYTCVGHDNSHLHDADNWTDIVAISVNGDLTGLKSDGTFVSTIADNYSGRAVKNWKDTSIIAFSSGANHTVGLKTDGTVVSTKDAKSSYIEWTDIIDISVGFDYTIGLKSDGTVIADCGFGGNDYGRCNVNGWTDIVAISAGSHHTVGLKSDGTVVAVGNNKYKQCDVMDWKLFNSIETIESDRIQARKRLISEYKAKGLCQHCGGSFKGIFSKKCIKCGKEKDY